MAMTSRQALLLTWVFGIVLLLSGLNLAVEAWLDRIGPYWLLQLGFGVFIVLGGIRALVKRRTIAAQFEQLSRRK